MLDSIFKRVSLFLSAIRFPVNGCPHLSNIGPPPTLSLFPVGGDILLLSVIGLLRLGKKTTVIDFDISSSVLATTYRQVGLPGCPESFLRRRYTHPRLFPTPSLPLQATVWMSFLLVPMLPTLAVAIYFLEFYLRRTVVLYASRPPRRTYRLTATVYKR